MNTVATCPEKVLAALKAVVAAAQPLPVPMGENFEDPFPARYSPEVEAARDAINNAAVWVQA